MAPVTRYRTGPAGPDGSCLWQDELAGDIGVPRPALDGDGQADIVVVGAGYTGLWTAYYLARLAPDRAVTVVEARTAGFGASGRNGGWCTTEMPALLANLVRRYGPMPAMRLYRAGRRTLDEIETVLAREGIDCGWRRDGSLYLATTAPQRDRLLAWQDLRLKLGITDLAVLAGAAARDRLAVPGVLLAGYTPNCAVVQPARIARGLARAVERAGVRIVEGTRVLRVGPGAVLTDRGLLRAQVVLCGTEAYNGALAVRARQVLPVRSRLLATAPLPAALWQRLGWHDRVTVADSRYQFGYFQRTADDRLVAGGRGAGYRAGSRAVGPSRGDARVYARLRAMLAGLDPELREVEITHSWAGAYGLHRDTEPAVLYDPATRIGYAGGYGGEGIALANLAGRTLAALVAGVDRPETRLCWTNHRGRRWEPEPLRLLGVRAVSALASRADAYEDRTGRRAPLAGPMMRAVL